MKKAFFLLVAGFSIAAQGYGQMYIDGNLYIAPGAAVACASHVISQADILGSGALIMNGPNVQGLDMNNHVIPRLGIRNPNGVVLGSNAVIGDSLIFAAGKLILVNNNLLFTSNAGHAGVAPNRFIVTNGTGGVIRQNMATGGSFLFPVGKDTAFGDLTPALVTNTGTTRNINVRVKDYATSAAVENNVSSGIDRTWAIASDVAGPVDISLSHNAGTEGSAFNHNAAFVTRQLSAAGDLWSLGVPSAGTNGGLTHSGSFVLPQGPGFDVYFSKSSDVSVSLPVGTVAAAGSSVNVVPNPFNETARLLINATASARARYLITDVTGRSVASAYLDIEAGANNWPLPIQRLAAGAYMISISAVTPGSPQGCIRIIKR